MVHGGPKMVSSISIRFAARALLLTLIFLPHAAWSATKEIKFGKGKVSTAISGAAIRGEHDEYIFDARAGQAMDLKIRSNEGNGVFAVYRPGFKKSKDRDGIDEIVGECLPGAGPTDDATTWSGVLPESGKYLIDVGGTRGSVTYTLELSIK